jgi:hypothetical protein
LLTFGANYRSLLAGEAGTKCSQQLATWITRPAGLATRRGLPFLVTQEQQILSNRDGFSYRKFKERSFQQASGKPHMAIPRRRLEFLRASIALNFLTVYQYPLAVVFARDTSVSTARQ